jgi:predicted ATPase
MRLVEALVQNTPPIQLARIQSMSNVVVLAGPNGVGKTRLISALSTHVQSLQKNPNVAVRLEATNEDEKQIWGKSIIDTGDQGDLVLLQKTLQKSRKRSKFTSSFLNFESNRTIQKINPFGWDWNFGDPYEEEVGWNFGFTNMTNRFQDLIHSIFRKIRSRREAIARHYEELVSARKQAEAGGDKSASLKQSVAIDPSLFPDALEPFKAAFHQLLAPKELLDPELQNQQLFYRTEKGEKLPITSLSSGEREVVNIVFDFLLRSPSDCIIIFDEPELHLHPELSYRLLQTLRRSGDRNQFIFCTHSAEIITASLDNTVAFIAPPREPSANQALIVTENDETHEALKLLGQSIGIISLGKRLVLIEGEQGSLDKQTYGAILKDRFPKLVLVPSGGRGLLQSFALLNDRVLARTIWGVQFFMLCDRDALPISDPRQLEADAAQRVKLLDRYHLENYFLDEVTIAKLFEPMTQPDDWLRSPEKIGEELRTIAAEHASYAAALTTSALFRERVGNVDLMPKGCNNRNRDELAKLILDKTQQEKDRVLHLMDLAKVEMHVKSTMEEIEASLRDGSDRWKAIVPGKAVVRAFCGKASIKHDNFRTAYINASDKVPNNPFAEIIKIFEHFDSL